MAPLNSERNYTNTLSDSIKQIVEGGTGTRRVEYARKWGEVGPEKLKINWIGGENNYDNSLHDDQPYMDALSFDNGRRLQDMSFFDTDKGQIPWRPMVAAVSIEDRVYVASSGNLDGRMMEFLDMCGSYLQEKWSRLGKEARTLRIPASEEDRVKIGGYNWFYCIAKNISADRKTYMVVSPGHIDVRYALMETGYDYVEFESDTVSLLTKDLIGIKDMKRKKEIHRLNEIFSLSLRDFRSMPQGNAL